MARALGDSEKAPWIVKGEPAKPGRPKNSRAPPAPAVNWVKGALGCVDHAFTLT